MKTTQDQLQITVNQYGHISFHNSQNNFFVTPREIREELNGSLACRSLRFACNLLSIKHPVELLNLIGYQLNSYTVEL